MKKANIFTCSCINCTAQRLCVNCGCQFEAKQFEHHEVLMQETNKHTHEAIMRDPQMAEHMEADMRNRFFIALLLVIPMFVIMHVQPFSHVTSNLLLLILATPVVFWSGSVFVFGAYYSLKNKKLNMSVLIATGVLISYFASIAMIALGQATTYFEAAGMLVTFVLFGHWMEMKARRGTTDALRALFKLVPAQAIIMREGKEITINSSDLIVGDTVLLRPGDKVPIDGVVLSGQTSIDESLITGESHPVLKKEGDEVIGGSINQGGSIRFQVTKEAHETVLASIIQLVETAQTSKAPGQRLADKAAAYLVVIAIGSGIITCIAWLIAGAEFATALNFAVAAIVIACPDALGLATPTAVAVATGLGAQHNILIKNATTLEQASKITTIFMDKTGTLTEGKPQVADLIVAPGFTERDVLYYGGSLQTLSSHSIAQAILQKAQQNSIALSHQVSQFESTGGLGLKGLVDNSLVLTGSTRFMQDQGIDIASMRSEIELAIAQGKSISIVAQAGKIIGAYALIDAVRPTAKKTIDGFKKLGIEIIMMTGDAEQVAEQIAHELGIEQYYAQVLPEEKLNYIKQWQEKGKFVAMVGDGINDAPALVQADIGIAIGAGTDVAIESASIVLMKSDPFDILKAITLSKATVRKMKENLFWASIYNVLAIPIAAGILYKPYGISLSPEISALFMSLSSIIVALNAVSLKRTELD